jgi:hypothetical protein
MSPQELAQADQLIAGLNAMLGVLQQEGKMLSYEFKTKQTKIGDGKAIEWSFRTWKDAKAWDFEWQRLYPYTGDGVPMHQLQIVSWTDFQEDLNDLMLKLISRYPQIAELTQSLIINN